VLGKSLGSSEMEISGSTLVYGLIGDPVDHSLSPAIQNAAFRSVGLNAVYLTFQVRAAELKRAIQGLRSLNVKGFNVTTPHKMAVLRHLDEVETEAAEIGSINTVKNERNVLVGFNTDGEGALKAMLDAGMSPDGRTVLLLGAGGAGRVIAYAFAERGCSLQVANRTVSNAKRLARSLHANFGLNVKTLTLSRRALKESVTNSDVILNASSMGMDGKHNPPIERKWIQADQCVFDIVYRPVQTKLLKDAAFRGASTVSGLDMLVCQGACSFTLWSGKRAPIAEMRRAVAKKLSSRNAASR